MVARLVKLFQAVMMQGYLFILSVEQKKPGVGEKRSMDCDHDAAGEMRCHNVYIAL